MMRLVVEIHPGGDELSKRTIASIDIANVSELAPTSSYEVSAYFEGRTRSFMVHGHKREDGWVPLVNCVLATLEALELTRSR